MCHRVRVKIRSCATRTKKRREKTESSYVTINNGKYYIYCIDIYISYLDDDVDEYDDTTDITTLPTHKIINISFDDDNRKKNSIIELVLHI